MPLLFDRFSRVQNSQTAAIPGSGLGLYIAHHIIQAHGGSLSIEPAPGDGTIAEVMVPLFMEAEEDAPESDGTTETADETPIKKPARSRNGPGLLTLLP